MKLQKYELNQMTRMLEVLKEQESLSAQDELIAKKLESQIELEKRKNTILTYVRDGACGMTANSVVLRGPLQREDFLEMKSCCTDGRYFLPYKVGLPEEQHGCNQSTNPMFELTGYKTTDRMDDGITVEEIVRRFRKNKNHWLDRTNTVFRYVDCDTLSVKDIVLKGTMAYSDMLMIKTSCLNDKYFVPSLVLDEKKDVTDEVGATSFISLSDYTMYGESWGCPLDFRPTNLRPVMTIKQLISAFRKMRGHWTDHPNTSFLYKSRGGMEIREVVLKGSMSDSDCGKIRSCCKKGLYFFPDLVGLDGDSRLSEILSIRPTYKKADAVPARELVKAFQAIDGDWEKYAV